MTTSGPVPPGEDSTEAELRGFVPCWIRATFLGWALGFVLVLVLLGIVSAVGLGDTQFALGLGMGTGVGLLQMRALPAAARARRAWLAASAVGLLLPFLTWDVIDAWTTRIPYSLASLVVAGGLLTGLLQWRILRTTARAAGWWVVAAAAGWMLAASTLFFNDRFLPRIPGLTGALLYIAVVMVGGVPLGLAGAPVLAHILKRPRTEPTEAGMRGSIV